MSQHIYTEIPFTLCSILAVIFLIKYFQTQRFFPLILSGIFFALAVLTRPVGLFLFIFIIFLILFRQPRWDNVKHVVVLAMAMIILILPWTIRNYVVFGKFIPVTTQGSLVLWVSNNHGRPSPLAFSVHPGALFPAGRYFPTGLQLSKALVVRDIFVAADLRYHYPAGFHPPDVFCRSPLLRSP